MDARARTGLALVCMLIGTMGAALPAGAADGALVGMRGIFDAQTGDRLSRRLVQVDLGTAAQAPVGGEVDGLAAFSAGESTFDPVGRRLILDGYDDDEVNRLFVFDARTGTLIADPEWPAPQPGTHVTLDAFEFDQETGSLLAMRGIFEDQPPFTRLSRRLVQVDLATAALSPVGGEIADQALFSNSESTFDAAGRRLIFAGLDDAMVRRIFVVDADTGALIGSPALPPPAAGTRATLNQYEFDGAGGALLAIRGVFDAQAPFARRSRRLVRIDLDTAAQTPVGGELPGLAFFGSESTFDPVARRLIFEGIDDADVRRLYVIDAQTGAVIASPAVPAPPVGTDVTVNALEFDPLAMSLFAPAAPTVPIPTVTTGGPPPASPTVAVVALSELRRALRSDASSAKRTLKRLGIDGLLERGGFAIRGFDALTAGTLRATLKTRKRMLAKARRAFDEPGRYRVKVKLTRKGKRMLRRSRRRAAALELAFRDRAGRTVRRSKQVTLRR